jgi:hypothetical protein
MSSPSVATVARPLVLIVAASLAIAACSSAAAPPTAGTPAPSSPASAGPSAAPSQPATTQPSANPDDPVTSSGNPGLGGGSGSGDGGKLVIPHPGTINPHPVAVENIDARVDGRHVTAKLTWTSGVEPCYVLDSVVVSKDGTTIDLTVVEGSADQTAVCIEIAQTKSTIVDLGDLEPGTWTINATNSQIPPVTVTVS